MAEPQDAPATSPRPPVLAGWLGRFGPMLAVLVIGGLGVAISLVLFWREAATLAHAAGQPARIESDWLQSDWPDFLEATAEQSLRASPPDESAAYVAAKRAVELDPSRASAWAILSYVEYRQARGIGPSVLDALAKSMAACPLCDQALIRWRFNFVLSHWDDMPEDLRRKAFEHADILRWMGQNAEFLAEMRYKAQLRDIPFDTYRAAVDTPARSWDLPPAAQLRGARNPPG